MAICFQYTSEHIAFLKAHVPYFPWKTITKLFNQRFGTTLTLQALRQVANRRKINRPEECRVYQKGLIPWNKGVTGYMGANRTSFKKGIRPASTCEVGEEKYSPKNNVFYVKVAEPNIWKPRSHIVLEQGGQSVPKGFVVFHKNGDGTDDRVENLLVLSRSVQVRLNHCVKVYGMPYKDLPPALQETVLLKAQLHEKIKEMKHDSRS